MIPVISSCRSAPVCAKWIIAGGGTVTHHGTIFTMSPLFHISELLGAACLLGHNTHGQWHLLWRAILLSIFSEYCRSVHAELFFPHVHAVMPLYMFPLLLPHRIVVHGQKVVQTNTAWTLSKAHLICGKPLSANIRSPGSSKFKNPDSVVMNPSVAHPP